MELKMLCFVFSDPPLQEHTHSTVGYNLFRFNFCSTHNFSISPAHSTVCCISESGMVFHLSEITCSI